MFTFLSRARFTIWPMLDLAARAHLGKPMVSVCPPVVTSGSAPSPDDFDVVVAALVSHELIAFSSGFCCTKKINSRAKAQLVSHGLPLCLPAEAPV